MENVSNFYDFYEFHIYFPYSSRSFAFSKGAFLSRNHPYRGESQRLPSLGPLGLTARGWEIMPGCQVITRMTWNILFGNPGIPMVDHLMNVSNRWCEENKKRTAISWQLIRIVCPLNVYTPAETADVAWTRGWQIRPQCFTWLSEKRLKTGHCNKMNTPKGKSSQLETYNHFDTKVDHDHQVMICIFIFVRRVAWSLTGYTTKHMSKVMGAMFCPAGRIGG